MAIDKDILKILTEECDKENLSNDIKNKLFEILNTWDLGQEIDEQIKTLIENGKIDES